MLRQLGTPSEGASRGGHQMRGPNVCVQVVMRKFFLFCVSWFRLSAARSAPGRYFERHACVQWLCLCISPLGSFRRHAYRAVALPTIASPRRYGPVLLALTTCILCQPFPCHSHGPSNLAGPQGGTTRHVRHRDIEHHESRAGPRMDPTHRVRHCDLVHK